MVGPGGWAFCYGREMKWNQNNFCTKQTQKEHLLGWGWRWRWGWGAPRKPDHLADSHPQARVRKMLAKLGLQRPSAVGLFIGCVQVYERSWCVTQPPASLSGLPRQPLSIFFSHPNLPLNPQRIAGPSHHSAKIEFPPK